MSGRPCNPGSDLRQLWQALLGDTPLPQCGVDEKQDAPPAVDAPDAERASKRDDDAAVQRKR